MATAQGQEVAMDLERAGLMKRRLTTIKSRLLSYGPTCLPKLSCAERSLHVNAMIPKTLYIPSFLISPQSSSSVVFFILNSTTFKKAILSYY